MTYVHPVRQECPGLMLCKCGHTKSGHALRPLWYGAKECEVRCADCNCQTYEQGAFQGMAFQMGGK